MSLEGYIGMWMDQILSRGESRHSQAFLKHLLEFPPEALASFMPWSAFAIPLIAVRKLREHAKKALKNELLVFSLVMVAANFPLYWLLPNAYVRYILPAGPFVAIALAACYDACSGVLEERPGGKALFAKSAGWLAFVSALVVTGMAVSQGLKISARIALPAAAVSLTAGLVIMKGGMISFRSVIPVIALWVGLFSVSLTEINTQKATARGESPKEAAHMVSRSLPPDVHKVYEIGYRRLLAVTCYLERDIVQLDGFSQLRSAYTDGNAYFLFDTDLIENLGADEKEFFDELEWEKLGSSTFEKGGNEVVLGRLL
jgi:hypothetical protein